jgi:hypothetical protein
MKNAPDTRYVYTHKHTWCVHGRTPRDGEGRLGWRQIRTVRLNEPKRDDSLAHSFPFLFICWLCACSICNDCTFSWVFRFGAQIAYHSSGSSLNEEEGREVKFKLTFVNSLERERLSSPNMYYGTTRWYTGYGGAKTFLK